MRKTIKQITKEEIGLPIRVEGWVKTRRDSKSCSFVEIVDGSAIKGIQGVIPDTIDAEIIKKITTGASIIVIGKLVESPGANQDFEISVEAIEIVGEADSTYPIQKKPHTPEFLRTIPHLRLRGNTMSSVMRVRNACAYAIHTFFQEKGFIWAHTPILTSSDSEGAGDMFSVISTGVENYFGKPAYLTVSGQLEGEAMATAFKNIYTFGPTFRAEKSMTTRHLSEFWMVEPEMSFCDLSLNIDVAEEFLKYLFKHVLSTCEDDLMFFNKWMDKTLLESFKSIIEQPFERVTYTEAIGILEKVKTFKYPVQWGLDLQTEHERYLSEEHFKKPVVVTDYPADIKSFYMRLNSDGKTVAAMDILFPKIGEIIGGSQREERYDVLLEKVTKQGLDIQTYQWYLDLRKYGTVPHSGFGLGFERLVQYMCGISNIRDVIAFPRAYTEI